MALGVFLNSTEEMEKENILNTDPWSSCSAGNCSNRYNKSPHFQIRMFKLTKDESDL